MKKHLMSIVLVAIGAVCLKVESYNALIKQNPTVEHQEKMADIQYKKETSRAKAREKEAKIENKFEQKKETVKQKTEDAKAKLERQKRESHAKYNREQAVLDAKKGQEAQDLARYEAGMREVQSYK